ncbi:CoA ester lyase [Haloechinothrix salitolerans]
MIDLEDAVAPEEKDDARSNVAAWLQTHRSAIIRINDTTTRWHLDDVRILQPYQCIVVLPKASDSNEISNLRMKLNAESYIVPLIETARGVVESWSICQQPMVARVIFGNVDFGLQLGVSPTERLAMFYARSMLPTVSAAAGLAPPIDGLTTAIRDEKTLKDDLDHAARLGFGGKLCLHPNQVATTNSTFTPSIEDIKWARSVIDMAKEESATVLNGEVVGKPVIERARLLIARAERTVDQVI